jgi:gluconokinase
MVGQMDKRLRGRVFVVMGVASSGKSSLGEALVKVLNIKFIDGDDLHPKENILKMASGKHLNDEDRIPWLVCIRDAAFSIEKRMKMLLLSVRL